MGSLIDISTAERLLRLPESAIREMVRRGVLEALEGETDLLFRLATIEALRRQLDRWREQRLLLH